MKGNSRFQKWSFVIFTLAAAGLAAACQERRDLEQRRAQLEAALQEKREHAKAFQEKKEEYEGHEKKLALLRGQLDKPLDVETLKSRMSPAKVQLEPGEAESFIVTAAGDSSSALAALETIDGMPEVTSLKSFETGEGRWTIIFAAPASDEVIRPAKKASDQAPADVPESYKNVWPWNRKLAAECAELERELTLLGPRMPDMNEVQGHKEHVEKLLHENVVGDLARRLFGAGKPLMGSGKITLGGPGVLNVEGRLSPGVSPESVRALLEASHDVEALPAESGWLRLKATERAK